MKEVESESGREFHLEGKEDKMEDSGEGEEGEKGREAGSGVK